MLFQVGTSPRKTGAGTPLQQRRQMISKPILPLVHYNQNQTPSKPLNNHHLTKASAMHQCINQLKILNLVTQSQAAPACSSPAANKKYKTVTYDVNKGFIVSKSPNASHETSSWFGG